MNLEKCFFHVIDYLFTPSGLPVVAPKDDTIQVHLTDNSCENSLSNEISILASTLIPPSLTVGKAE